VPKLELRTLLIKKDSPIAYYEYCVKWRIFKKSKTKYCKERHTDYYDLRIEKDRHLIINKGFVLKIRRMP